MDRPPHENAPDAGLCAECRWSRRVRNARGSVFLRCARAEQDATFVKYPRLPRNECRGFEPGRAPVVDRPAGEGD